MCDLCGGDGQVTPEKLEALHQKTTQTILNHGQEVRFVYADEEHPAFAYTIGRTLREQPEILITGNLRPDIVLELLNSLGAMINNEPELYTREEISDGLLLQGLLGNDFVAYLAPVRDLEEAQMFGVTNMFPDADWAIQLVWPDNQGRFPFEEECSLPPNTQPLYIDYQKEN